MSTVNNGPQIVRNGLVLNLDASSVTSYSAISVYKVECYSTFGGGLRSANYTVQYSDDNSTWTTAFTGVMSNNSSCGIIAGTNRNDSNYSKHRYWRYVEGGAVVGHHPRVSRIDFITKSGAVYNLVTYTTDNCADSGTYIVGTVSKDFGTTTWRDISGNAINFTTFNTPVFNNANYGSLTFNGSSTYATAPENSLFNTDTLTIECWARTSSINQNGFFFEKGTVNSQYAIFIEGTQIKIRTSTGISGVADLQFTAASYIQANVWFLVTASYNNGLKRFYINGVLLGTQTVTGGFTINASGMSIGAYGGFSGAKSYYYSGDIANVKFYNRVLTDAEVSQNYEATRKKFGL